MEEWFQQASFEECDAMTALQLDYRFEGDNFASMWWMLFQELEFKHTGTAYELPKTFPCSNDETIVASEIYKRLDSFAIPQVTDSFQTAISPTNSLSKIRQKMTKDQAKWWRKTRRELIFRKFYKEIEATTIKQGNRKARKSKATTKKRTKKSQTKTVSLKDGKDAGAELYLRRTNKNKRAKVHSKTNVIHEEEIEFPTVAEYAHMAREEYDEQSYLYAVQETFYSSFDEWRFIVDHNQSLLLYGSGSKRRLIEEFVQRELKKHGDVLVIDGYDKDVAIIPILELIVYRWLDASKELFILEQEKEKEAMMTFSTRGNPLIVEKAFAIGKALAQVITKTTRQPLYLCIHNIDGVGLRNHTAQEALAALVASSSFGNNNLNCIRLVASIDHVNAPMLLWDSLVSATFQFYWLRVDTHRPFISEVTESKISMGESKGSSTFTKKHQQFTATATATKKSTFEVLDSLAPRVAQSLQQLVTIQLNTGKTWVDHKDLLKQCQLNCIVSSDSQLRGFLGEMFDHKIVQKDDKKYHVPHSRAGLEKILNYVTAKK